MADISRSRTIAASPTAVWRLLSDFGAIADWADGIDHSCLLNHVDSDPPLGLTRRVQTGRDVFVETVTTWRPPLVLGYAITGVPRALSVSNRWNLAPRTDDATTVTVTSTVGMRSRLLGPIAEQVFTRLMTKRSDALLHSLADAVERVP